MLEVGWLGVGVIKRSFQKDLKTGWVKAEVVRKGKGGFEGVTTPAPRKILIIHKKFQFTYIPLAFD